MSNSYKYGNRTSDHHRPSIHRAVWDCLSMQSSGDKMFLVLVIICSSEFLIRNIQFVLLISLNKCVLQSEPGCLGEGLQKLVTYLLFCSEVIVIVSLAFM